MNTLIDKSAASRTKKGEKKKRARIGDILFNGVLSVARVERVVVRYYALQRAAIERDAPPPGGLSGTAQHPSTVLHATCEQTYHTCVDLMAAVGARFPT